MAWNGDGSRRRFLKGLAAGGALLASGEVSAMMRVEPAAGESGPKEAVTPEEAFRRHPAGAALRRLFPGRPGATVEATGLARADYLPVITGIVDFFRAHQDARGAILDPYEHREIQYATPAFAAAAARLVRETGRDDLREPAARALTFALQALAQHKAADGHSDFYIPLLMYARRWLDGHAPSDVQAEWTQILTSLVPEKTYSDVKAHSNWNVVNLSGECLRRQDGLVAPDQRDAQLAYIERCLTRQERAMTRFGMYHDANAPLAYDIFPRLWLEVMFAPGVYPGAQGARWHELLTLGGLSTLLLLSPSGEWPCGGRSAHHQWNEAAVAVVCEANARRWQAWGRPDVAGAFKRAAHLALTSLRRWRRPSGELWIVKNRSDPRLRLGYETYSFHSQYNLLPAAMLAIAHAEADDAIPEAPVPAEWGSYVFDVRPTFHKICACAGGTYALLATAADPHYDATGLMRVHRAGVSLSAFSDNTAADRAYGPPKEPAKAALAPGIAWESADGPGSVSLADFVGPHYADKARPRAVESAALRDIHEEPTEARLTVRYTLRGDGAHPVEEEYRVSADGLEVVSRLTGNNAPGKTQLVFPVLVSDGATDRPVHVASSHAASALEGTETIWELVTPSETTLTLGGPRIPSHNGWVQAANADLPTGTREVRWRVRFTKSSAP